MNSMMVRNRIRLLLIVFTEIILFSSISSKSLILEPINKENNLEQIGIIFVQGAGIDSNKYVELSQKIQEENKQFKIWVSITNAYFDLPLWILSKLAIDQSYQDLLSKGLTPESKFFLIGHSLGGIAALNYYIKNKNKMNIQGLVMLGSIPERKNRSETEGLNILVLGGELDGLSRVTRLTEEFYQRNLDSNKNLKRFETLTSINNKLKFLQDDYVINSSLNSTSIAVIVFEGLNHMSFASGKPTWFVSKRDLKAEVDQETGHKKISQLVNYFLNSNGTAINNDLQRSHNFFNPIIEAFELEGSIHFNRPDQSKCHRGYCNKGSYWTIQAQKILSMESQLKENNVTMNITNDFVILSSLPPLGDLFHPKMRLENNTLTLSTYSQCSWSILDKYVDGGFSSVSASEIGSKMYSRQCSLVYGANHKKEETPLIIDSEGNICAEINRQAFDWALNKASNRTSNRYNENGQKLNFVEDKLYANGFSWTYNILNWEEDTNSGIMNVKSYTMVTDIDAKPLPIFAPDGLDCYHYCKLLSPARAIEWIYVDGLRKKYHI